LSTISFAKFILALKCFVLVLPPPLVTKDTTALQSW
jgi:hypothetical protein